MKYIAFSHSTALEYWRRNELELADRAPRLGARTEFSCDLGQAKSFGPAAYATPNRPVHVLVRNQSGRRPSDYVVPHVTAWINERSLLLVRPGVLISSPELTLLQFACGRELPLLMELVYEFCGTYRINPMSERGFDDAAPLTSVSKLKRFLGIIPARTRGKANLERAVRYAHDKSASPRETIIAILFALPVQFGGYGMNGFEMNGKVKLEDAGYNILQSHHCKCDLLWRKQKLAIEYDSDLAHTGAARIERDAKRRTALLEEGYTVITLTRRQVNYVGQLNEVARIIARKTGKRERLSEKARIERSELRKALLSPHIIE